MGRRARTLIRPWSPGDPVPGGVVALEDPATCPACGYSVDSHRGPDGVFDEREHPAENTARALYGDR